MVSYTGSTDFPTTAGVIQPNNAGGQDAVIFKMTPNLDVVWSTYFGSSADDLGYGIRVDEATGDILVSGSISSNNAYSWANAAVNYQGGSLDAYLLRLSPDASSIIGNTYFGSTSRDDGYFVDIDSYGKIYLYGLTGNVITPSTGVFSTNGNLTISKFTENLDTIEFQTTIGNGSSNTMVPDAFMVDICNRIYISGHAAIPDYGLSSLSGYPLSSDAEFTAAGGIYVAVFEENAVNLNYATYIPGADHVDGGTSRFDPNGYIYQAMCSCNGFDGGLPTTAGAYGATMQTSNCDLGVIKMQVTVPFVQANFHSTTLDTLCAPATVELVNTSENGYTYEWNFGDGSPILSMGDTIAPPPHVYPDTGTYVISLIATNPNVCIPTDTILYVITVLDLTVDLTNNGPLCTGEELLIFNETTLTTDTNLTYNWAGPNSYSSSDNNDSLSVSQDVTLPMDGLYSVTVTDNFGCSITGQTTAIIHPDPIPNAGPDQVLCAGTATLTATGGSIYEWTDTSGTVLGSTASITVGQTADTSSYIVLVTSVNGCENSDTVDVIVGSIDFDTTITNVTCYNGTDGEIDLIINGTPPYTYSWSQGSSSNLISNLSAGDYTASVTDNIGCELINTFTIIQPTLIQAQSIPTNTLCIGSADGQINLSVSEGTPGYTFAWNDVNSQTTEDATGLIAGTYIVNITDTNNCTITHTQTVAEPSQIVTTTYPTNISCFGLNDGDIQLDITGGTPPYTFNWTNGQHTEDINELEQNTYSVTVIDANNCTVTNTGVITEPLEIIIQQNTNSILCYGDLTGIIDINVNGGVTPYFYTWSNQANTQNLTNVAAGDYTVTVTDNTGCTRIQNVSLNQPSQLVTTLPNNYIHCNHETTILASVEGGTSPYSYQWNGGSVSQTSSYQTNNTQTYVVTVTDNNNCTSVDEIEITIISVSLEAYVNLDTVCPGDPVLITTNIEGGLPPYTFYNNGQQINPPLIIYPNGQSQQLLSVVDACDNTDDAIINVNTYPVLPLSFTADILNGCVPLQVSFNQHSYNTDFYYSWSFNDASEGSSSNETNPVHLFTESGLYDISVQVTDNNSCKNSAIINNMIEVYPTPIARFNASPEVVSFLNPLVSFNNYSVDNYLNYWYFDDENSSSITSPNHKYNSPGVYYPVLIVETDKGCLDSTKGMIEVKDEFTLYVPTAFSPDGDQINDGFRAEGHGIDLDNYRIYVYDRWGEVIWESEDLYEYWNATVKGGDKIAQNGVYTWLIICNDFNGIEHTKSGTVNLIR